MPTESDYPDQRPSMPDAQSIDTFIRSGSAPATSAIVFEAMKHDHTFSGP